ncbi:MAG: amidohydrolase family protein [Chitinophagales bacterium]|nr:amidohydrolase family protein [Bacteroidota bacterium]MCB9044434.1 amidohydrolase family protein [Chitinophagales bacterium]
MYKICFFLSVLSCFFSLQAQETFPINGTKDQRSDSYVFTHATIYKNYQEKLTDANLHIENGKVVAVGKNINIPKDAVIIDCSGKYIYPAFIEMIADYGISSETQNPKQSYKEGRPQFVSNKKGAYGWNEAIRPEIQAYTLFSADTAAANAWRKMGFGAVLSHQQDGIARGTAVLVSLANKSDNELIIKDKAAAMYSFSKGSSRQDYPSSLMGTIALLRQTYYDAQWYAQNNPSRKEYNLSLAAFNENMALPQIFDPRDRLSELRADKIGDEFGVQYILKGTGEEYQQINDIKATQASFIIPVNYPDAYNVSDPYDALYVDLEKLKHWELAPYNLERLAEANITFAITSDGLKNKTDFWKNIQKSVENGLDSTIVLKALSYVPAQLLQVSDKLGSLENGKIANFFIASDNIFDKGIILESWVQGQMLHFGNSTNTELFANGDYRLWLSDTKRNYTLQISGEKDKQNWEIALDDTLKVKVTPNISEQELSISFSLPPNKEKYRLAAWKNKNNTWQGKGQNAQGEWIDWTLGFIAKNDSLSKKMLKDSLSQNDKMSDDMLTKVCYPFLPYGWTEKPEAATVLIKNATLWTNEKEGILENTDILLQNGKIAAIGKDLPESKAQRIIDATGKYVTSGIIDEHSHIAISKGVNEGTQASSAEVRIGDVVNSQDINIYRQLAGGVTVAQLLHGSANPIGGQSVLIKLRWGYNPEEMKFQNAAPFIKFALGENVKQSNWGDNQRERFPQTRMGVAQVYDDYFNRARIYERESKKPNARRDLELDAILEILNQKRFITCHSYVQSEINMLMKVTEKWGFHVNTFTHILEGYKLADKIKEHGAAASTFSDWWMYKFEVNDAIPYNGAILNEMDIVTGFNSDDADMARRLNAEAAKGVKYGKMSEEDAWKLVTLNPAKMLHIDQQVGSLKVGKDADVVVWNEKPLSVFAKAEYTFVDGICFFDIEKDAQMRQEINAERNRLIQKMLDENKKDGKKKQKPGKKENHFYHCDDIENGLE